MESRTILHSDLNSFYASVEMMLDPSLRGKAVAVCGRTEDRHGIVLAKSDLAKKAGVKTGMVNWEARQCCPNLVVVPPQYDQYLKYSALARNIYQRFTDLVEPYGMDECWLDVTGSRAIAGSGMEIAETIRRTMQAELGLTVSIGVSYNKIFAKLGSDMKKPNAITRSPRRTSRRKSGPSRPPTFSMWGGPPKRSWGGTVSAPLATSPRLSRISSSGSWGSTASLSAPMPTVWTHQGLCTRSSFRQLNPLDTASPAQQTSSTRRRCGR